MDTLTSDLTLYENGTVDVTQQGLAHFKGVSQGNIQNFAFEKREPLRIEHQNFRDSILGKCSEIVTLESGCKTVAVAEAVIRSYKTQVAVAL